jgi:hypothetical protein
MDSSDANALSSSARAEALTRCRHPARPDSREAPGRVYDIESASGRRGAARDRSFALRNRKPLRLVVRPVSGVGRRAVVPRVACGAAVQVLAVNRTPEPRALFADLARGYPQARPQSQAPGTSDRRRRFSKYLLTPRTHRDDARSRCGLRSRARRDTTRADIVSAREPFLVEKTANRRARREPRRRKSPWYS